LTYNAYERRKIISVASLSLAAASLIFLALFGRVQSEGLIAVRDNLPGVVVTACVAAMMSGLGYAFYQYKWRVLLSICVCLFHDITLTRALIAIFRFDLSSAYAPVMLAVGGYSLNNLVALFERINNNQKLYPRWTTRERVNNALTQSAPRLLKVLVIFILLLQPALLFSDGLVRALASSFLAGAIVSSYSSLFFAASIWSLFSA